MSTFARFAFALAIAATGCATPQLLRPGELAPLATQVQPDQRTIIWQRAIEVLLDAGYVPQVLNEAACYVSAKQRDDLQVGSLSGTMAFVSVSPEGKLRVEVSGTGIYRSEDELAHDLAAEQQKLIDAIVVHSPAGGAPPSAPPAGDPLQLPRP